MRNIIYILTIFSLFCCRKESDNSKPSSADQAINATIKKSDSTSSYYFEDSVFTQSLEIQYLTQDSIRFEFTQESKLDSCSASIWGTAVSDQLNVDPEIDEDELGNSYPSVQYVNLDQECLLYIRIELDNKDRVRIVFGDCVDESAGKCGARELGILHRK